MNYAFENIYSESSNAAKLRCNFEVPKLRFFFSTFKDLMSWISIIIAIDGVWLGQYLHFRLVKGFIY